jgi:serine/threonine protein kinase
MTIDPSAVTEAGNGSGDPEGFSPGASIGKYRLDRVLGTGGMGVVWAAFDPDLERPVAIKVLRAADGSASMRTRLLREARAMARLKHPNVLTVYEVGTDRNRDYIAMELIDGMDLDRWLVSRPPRDEVLAALFAAGRGLAAAHGAGLIHRDLKPHNILRGRDGAVYVTDFGLARGQIEDGPEVIQTPVADAATAVGSQPRAMDSVLDSPLTQTGVLIGTPAYMAPEQFAGRAPDPRSDQFAFCVTAWEALTGARPFGGHNLEELRAAAAGGAPGAAQVPEAVLPPRVRAVLARGLSPAPEDRWPDMHAMLGALQSALAPSCTGRVPRIVWITLAVLAVLGFLTGVALYTRSHTGPTVVTSVVPVPAPPPVPVPPSIPGPRPGPGPGPGPGPNLAAGCKPPGEAFGGAWSAERRAAVVARHRAAHELLPATAALDEVRRAWLRGYEAACAMPESEARHDQLDCLLEAREAIDEATRELTEEDSKLSIVQVIPLNVVVSACTHE